MSMHNDCNSDADELARRVLEQMLSRDGATRALGMDVESVGPGTARVAMTVRPDMVNGFETCHGGMMFSLADSAFAFACNSQNRMTVAAGCSIEFLRAAHIGERLVASARVRAASGRSSVYDVEIRNEQDQIVALFVGKSRTVGGEVVPDADPASG